MVDMFADTTLSSLIKAITNELIMFIAIVSIPPPFKSYEYFFCDMINYQKQAQGKEDAHDRSSSRTE